MDELIPYMRAHPLYFMDESREEDVSPRFHAEVPDMWKAHYGFHWTSWFAPDEALPRQGWKVHVSAVLDNAEAILAIVAATCVELELSFKFLPSRKRLHARNSIGCAREHAGKFITCYPQEDKLEVLLETLEARLAGFEGPYILSDRRWRKAPVYVRFGSFRPDAGLDIESASFLHAPGGATTVDSRSVAFDVPPWAPVPQVLKDWLQQETEHSESNADSLPFTVTSAIQFSNSGGTYRGTVNDQPAIIKESRPLAGWDERGRDAVTRLKAQTAVLRELEGKAAVPKVLWSGYQWEHYFAAIEVMPGKPLNEWVTDNYPGYVANGETLPRYFTDARKILENLIGRVQELHRYGWAHLDLHPRNVLISADLNISLIDLECARRVDEPPVVHDVAAPGFRAPGRNSPAEIDQYCLAQFAAYLLCPAVELSDLVPSYREQLLDVAPTRLRLGRPDANDRIECRPIAEYVEYAHSVVRLLAPSSTTGVAARSGLRRFSPATQAQLPDPLGPRLAAGNFSPTGVDLGRRYPVHPFGLQQHNGGLAYGDFTIDVLSRALVHSNSNAIPTPIFGHDRSPLGLFTGEVGDLLINDLVSGPVSTAPHLRAQIDRWLAATGNRIYDGKPGILLGLVHLMNCRPELDEPSLRKRLIDECSRVATWYFDDPAQFAPLGPERAMLGNHPNDQNSGLLYGHLGLAWLAATVNELEPDELWLKLARNALVNELSGYVSDERYQTVQLRQGYRQLPYLSMGSAGFGVVLNRWDKFTLPAEVIDKAPGLFRATVGTISMFPGLFNGYAGLLVGRAGLARFIGEPNVTSNDLVKAMELYLLESDSGLHVAGDAGVRLTADVATGSSGIILAELALSLSNCNILPEPGWFDREPVTVPKYQMPSTPAHF